MPDHQKKIQEYETVNANGVYTLTTGNLTGSAATDMLLIKSVKTVRLLEC